MFSIMLNILLLWLSTDSIDSKITDFVISSFPGYDRYEVKIVSGKLSEFDFDASREVTRNNNLVYIPVVFSNKNGNSSRSIITCEVKFFKKIFVANRDIRKGENLNSTDFITVESDVARIDNYVSGYDELQNKRASAFIKKGEYLVSNLIEEIPLILPGDVVVLHSIKGSADVQIDAVAQQEGFPDKLIRVKTRDNKLYKAKVIDNKNVLINE